MATSTVKQKNEKKRKDVAKSAKKENRELAAQRPNPRNARGDTSSERPDRTAA